MSIILGTEIKGRKLIQTKLRDDGRLERRENESYGPTVVTFGGASCEFANMSIEETHIENSKPPSEEEGRAQSLEFSATGFIEL